jgi:membrane protein YqaA with SNARE-associated domain
MGMLETRFVTALTRAADRPALPWVAAAVAMSATLSMSVPYASMLVAAVLMAPRRWWSIALSSSLGAALGAALLYLVFHHLGWARLFAAYPEVVRSAAWADASGWLRRYGVISLLVIAVLPLPLTPALMFAAISRLPVVEVLAALWIGKLAKYTAYAWLTARYPGRLLIRGEARMMALHGVMAQATQASAPGPRKSGAE